jgi:hypothetical protein
MRVNALSYLAQKFAIKLETRVDFVDTAAKVEMKVIRTHVNSGQSW